VGGNKSLSLLISIASHNAVNYDLY